MTIEEAKQIKEWRVNEDFAWWEIATKAAILWPSKDIAIDDEIDGYYLCNKAMKMLGESHKDGWN